MEFRTSTFLTDGDSTRTFEELNYQDKAVIVALETLVELKNSLHTIANLPSEEALQTTVDTLNQTITDLNADKAALQNQLNSLQTQFDALRNALQAIDTITDEITD